jgi:ligand-binding SRPBCC domain-containing protein
MAVYERRTRVRAPLDEVWAFHSQLSGLEALTPPWMDLRVETVRGPEGERDPEVLDAGTTIRLSIRPFGVGPRQRWTSVILERTEKPGSARFRDEMREGPFRRWEHTHSFFADGDETLVVDRVKYELPLGPLSEAVSPLAWVGFEPMFRYRHRRTRELLGK